MLRNGLTVAALGLALVAGALLPSKGLAATTQEPLALGQAYNIALGDQTSLNDLYAVIFALPSILLLLGGVDLGWWWGCSWIGAGIAAYGTIYFGFHDVIVHRRVATRYLPRSAYMKRIIQAHRLHHVVETKRGTVSFGFLWAPPPETLKAELNRRGNAGVRAPSGDFVR